MASLADRVKKHVTKVTAAPKKPIVKAPTKKGAQPRSRFNPRMRAQEVPDLLEALQALPVMLDLWSVTESKFKKNAKMNNRVHDMFSDAVGYIIQDLGGEKTDDFIYMPEELRIRKDIESAYDNGDFDAMKTLAKSLAASLKKPVK